MSTAKSVEAVVIEGTRSVICNDCGCLVDQFRLQVTAPKQVAGVKLWSTPMHSVGGRPCPSRSHREVPRV